MGGYIERTPGTQEQAMDEIIQVLGMERVILITDKARQTINAWCNASDRSQGPMGPNIAKLDAAFYKEKGYKPLAESIEYMTGLEIGDAVPKELNIEHLVLEASAVQGRLADALLSGIDEKSALGAVLSFCEIKKIHKHASNLALTINKLLKQCEHRIKKGGE